MSDDVSDDGFEATFEVALPPPEVWTALTSSGGDGERWLAGFEATVDDVAVEPGTSLHVRKRAEPCAGTEIVITLAAAELGTTVRVVQFGFGEWFERMRGPLAVGWSHIVADLALFLASGARGGRHLRPWVDLGCAVRAEPAGLVVTDVHGGLGQEAGIEAGDVLLTVAGAPVVVEAELHAALRSQRAGTEVELGWARRSETMAGRGRR